MEKETKNEKPTMKKKVTPPKVSSSKSTISLNDIASKIMKENRQLDLKGIIDQEINPEDIANIKNKASSKSAVEAGAKGGVKKNATKNAPGDKKKKGKDKDFTDSFLADLFPGSPTVQQMIKNPDSGYHMIKKKLGGLFKSITSKAKDKKEPKEEEKNQSPEDTGTEKKDDPSKSTLDKIKDKIEKVVEKISSVGEQTEQKIIDDTGSDYQKLSDKIDNVSQSSEQIEDGIEDLTDKVNELDDKITESTDKIGEVYDRISVKDVSYGEGDDAKSFKYDPLGPQGKQVRQITKSGKVGGFASKGDSNRALTAAAYLGSSDVEKKDDEADPISTTKEKKTPSERVPRKDVSKIDNVLKIVKKIDKNTSGAKKEKPGKKEDKPKEDKDMFDSFLGQLLPGSDTVQKMIKNPDSGYHMIKDKLGFGKKKTEADELEQEPENTKDVISEEDQPSSTGDNQEVKEGINQIKEKLDKISEKIGGEKDTNDKDNKVKKEEKTQEEQKSAEDTIKHEKQKAKQEPKSSKNHEANEEVKKEKDVKEEIKAEREQSKEQPNSSKIEKSNKDIEVKDKTEESIHKAKTKEPGKPAPKVETPKLEAPKIETPKLEAPKIETPKLEAPKIETPKLEMPKTSPASGIGKVGDLAKGAKGIGNEIGGAIKGVSGLGKAAEGAAGLAGAAEGAAGAAGAAEGAAGLAGMAEGAAGLAGMAEGGLALAAALGPVGIAVGIGSMLLGGLGGGGGGGDDAKEEYEDVYKPSEKMGPVAVAGKEDEMSGKIVSRREGSHKETGSDIEDFGEGTPAVLHGREGVVTEERLQQIKSGDDDSGGDDSKHTVLGRAGDMAKDAGKSLLHGANEVAKATIPGLGLAEKLFGMDDDEDDEKKKSEDTINQKLDAIQKSVNDTAKIAAQSGGGGGGGGGRPQAGAITLVLRNDERSVAIYTASIFDHPVVHPGLFTM